MLQPGPPSPSNWPARVGKLRPDQIANRSNWTGVPDKRAAHAAAHIIHVVPHGATTVTHVNPVDPGSVGLDDGPGGYLPPSADAPVGRRLPR